MSDIQVSIPAGRPYGGFWRRVGAWIIDGIIILAPFLIVGSVLWPDLIAKTTTVRESEGGAFYQITFTTSLIGSIVLGVATWAYMALQESSRAQATLGKRALGIKVTNLTGGRVSLLTATVRSWPVWLPALAGVVSVLDVIAGLAALAACIAVAFTRRKQGLHDMMAKCLVVRHNAVFAAQETS